jgi:YegS/Rv2252/BmrU family lipid kinase
MKRLNLIYNPSSGDKQFKFSLDGCIGIFQSHGYSVQVLRVQGDMDFERHFRQSQAFDAVVVAGGDGTINLAVNAMLKLNVASPLGLIPSGTANDFASFIKMPSDPQEAAQAIMEGKAIQADVGRVNGRYFINVCGSGFFTNISTLVDNEAKDTLGKFAYYLKGLEQLPNFTPFRINIQTKTQELAEDVYLFIILNSAGAGGFLNLCPQASIQDGLFDFVAIRAKPVMELAMLFLKLLKGDFLDDSGILHLREPWFKINSIGDGVGAETDVDGEKGPDMPIEVEIEPKKLPLFVPQLYLNN